ncbi:GreA/GreB family elongation factor [Sphingomonas lutea]|uniref:GreA/GreB family elongation factor n=1 Tax=Sphingomonas lutea TaxID=1045317 RepID=A0A7G9SG62_9SPHN|nr:GreA/GreB family elongation factor [Sphingomonas lutea]QNN66837.1 GreA/GreB family elongation factor [Sphingomonas lutea]
MSVAFRRESDEEHLEPKFELPIPPGPNLVTRRGLSLIEQRNAELEGRLAAELPEDERKAVLRDARYWRQRLASAQLAPTPDGETVAIGTRVTILQGKTRKTLEIVGHDEADPAEKRITFASPLARAMLGANVGEVVDYRDDETIEIVAIEVRPD